jgi:hypothetical protein
LESDVQHFIKAHLKPKRGNCNCRNNL